MKDSEILERIGRGDESALDYIYRKYYKMMVRLVTSNQGTEEEAKDIFQEALLVLWQKANRGKLVLTSKISTYIYSICLNLWRKELDKKSRTYQDNDQSKSYTNNYESDELSRVVKENIQKLGDSCKKILMYYYFDGMSMEDITKKMNFANSETTKTKKYKCKRKLDILIRKRYTYKDFFD